MDGQDGGDGSRWVPFMRIFGQVFAGSVFNTTHGSSHPPVIEYSVLRLSLVVLLVGNNGPNIV